MVLLLTKKLMNKTSKLRNGRGKGECKLSTYVSKKLIKIRNNKTETKNIIQNTNSWSFYKSEYIIKKIIKYLIKLKRKEMIINLFFNPKQSKVEKQAET